MYEDLIAGDLVSIKLMEGFGYERDKRDKNRFRVVRDTHNKDNNFLWGRLRRLERGLSGEEIELEFIGQERDGKISLGIYVPLAAVEDCRRFELKTPAYVTRRKNG